MSFQLLVEFAGLCLYMADPGMKKVAILMPDARKNAEPMHQDGEDGEFHVGYIRFDLANLDVTGMTLPDPGELDDGSGTPRNEIIHRFDGQELDFGLAPDPNPMSTQIGVPDFGQFAGLLKPLPNLFAGAPPKDLLMRTTISGGKIEGTPKGKTWAFSSVLHKNTGGIKYSGPFAGFTLWTRQVNAPGLTITISDFKKNPAIQIPLKPRTIGGKQVIAIKVANLCSNNPMEWRDDFPIRTVVKHDLDFKWLYRLLTPATGDYETALAGAELPFPRAIPDQAYGDEDCMGGSITTPFP